MAAMQQVQVFKIVDNIKRMVTVKIEDPVKDDTSDAFFCVVRLDNEFLEPSSIHGVNALNALWNALVFVQSYFEGLGKENVVTTLDGEAFFINPTAMLASE